MALVETMETTNNTNWYCIRPKILPLAKREEKTNSCSDCVFTYKIFLTSVVSMYKVYMNIYVYCVNTRKCPFLKRNKLY